jgi:hypothetical protein
LLLALAALERGTQVVNISTSTSGTHFKNHNTTSGNYLGSVAQTFFFDDALNITNFTAARVALTIKGAASQSGAYLNITNSSDTAVFTINSSGAITTGSWSGTTIPVTGGGTGLTGTTINQLLYSSATNTIAGLATANKGVLITSTGGVPSILGSTAHGQILIAGASTAPAWGTITGTTNQITVGNAANSITLSLPQDINTSSTPQFAAVIVNQVLDVGANAVLDAISGSTYINSGDYTVITSGLGFIGYGGAPNATYSHEFFGTALFTNGVISPTYGDASGNTILYSDGSTTTLSGVDVVNIIANSAYHGYGGISGASYNHEFFGTISCNSSIYTSSLTSVDGLAIVAGNSYIGYGGVSNVIYPHEFYGSMWCDSNLNIEGSSGAILMVSGATSASNYIGFGSAGQLFDDSATIGLIGRVYYAFGSNTSQMYLNASNGRVGFNNGNLELCNYTNETNPSVKAFYNATALSRSVALGARVSIHQNGTLAAVTSGAALQVNGSDTTTTAMNSVQINTASAHTSGTRTSATGLYIPALTQSGGGTLTTAYGLFIDANTVGVTNYSAYFAGNVRCAGTSGKVFEVTGATSSSNYFELGGLARLYSASATTYFSNTQYINLGSNSLEINCTTETRLYAGNKSLVLSTEFATDPTPAIKCYYNATASSRNVSIPSRFAVQGSGTASAVTSGALARVTGGSDIVQLEIAAHSTQTSNIVDIKGTAGTTVAKVTGTGVVQAAGYQSSDGSAGTTEVIEINDPILVTTPHTLTFKNGLLTNYVTAS